MKKRWITLIVALLLATVSAISTTIILAGGEDVKSSDFGRLSTKVAQILGLDEAVVDDAIKQARRELKDEAHQAKLDGYQQKLAAMVENGELTQEEADEKLEAAKPQSHYYFGLKKKIAYRYEDFQSKLTAMVENGELTQEEADEKLEATQLKSHYYHG